MADGVRLLDAQVLGDLRRAFLRFVTEASDVSTSAKRTLATSTNWVAEAVAERKKLLRQCESDLDDARAALRGCRLQGDDDEEPDCSTEEADVVDAKRRLRAAEEDIRTALLWQRRVDVGVAQCSVELTRLRTVADRQGQLAIATLAEKLRVVQRYISIIPPVAPREGQTADPAAATWIDRGVVSIPLSDLPTIDSIHDSGDFQKVKLEEMGRGLERLQDMLVVMERGEGMTTDYWRALDEKEGSSYEHGRQRIFDAFFGGDAIHLQKYGDTYDVINGRHRIWLARKLGISSLPVKLTERTKIDAPPGSEGVPTSAR